MSEHDTSNEGHLTPKPSKRTDLVPSAFLSGRWDYLLASADVPDSGSSSSSTLPVPSQPGTSRQGTVSDESELHKTQRRKSSVSRDSELGHIPKDKG
jgi:hypothetical protein